MHRDRAFDTARRHQVDIGGPTRINHECSRLGLQYRDLPIITSGTSQIETHLTSQGLGLAGGPGVSVEGVAPERARVVILVGTRTRSQ
jgi:hypothetical protein